MHTVRGSGLSFHAQNRFDIRREAFGHTQFIPIGKEGCSGALHSLELNAKSLFELSKRSGDFYREPASMGRNFKPRFDCICNDLLNMVGIGPVLM